MTRAFPLLDLIPTRAERDAALKQIAQAAEDRRAEFHSDACACVLAYLETHGPTSGETLTIACKDAGIVPHDDRAFGPVYMALARSGAIVKVGDAVRRRGHGTSGGNVWARVR